MQSSNQIVSHQDPIKAITFPFKIKFKYEVESDNPEEGELDSFYYMRLVYNQNEASTHVDHFNACLTSIKKRYPDNKSSLHFR